MSSMIPLVTTSPALMKRWRPMSCPTWSTGRPAWWAMISDMWRVSDSTWRSGISMADGSGAGSDPLPDLLARRLLAQRMVLLHGPLDGASVTRVSAELMTLGAEGDDPVMLRVDCGMAALAPALALMDVIELMGVPVHVLCLGQVAGGAVGVAAVCARRRALPSTRFSLHEPPTTMEAHVRDVARWVALQAAERRRFCARVGAAAQKPPEEVERDLERGRFLTASEAVTYGLIDEVGRPDDTVHRFPGPDGPQVGLRPPG